MVEIRMTYEGGLRCRTTHGPSKAEFVTDAPVDNCGKGASFSPTDLVATALGTCAITTMGIVADRNGWDIDGARVRVVKHMRKEPRSIERIELELELPVELDAAARETLESTARNCPVARTLAGRVDMPIAFRWGAESV
jgi:uncharacterized OsmC-like protein